MYVCVTTSSCGKASEEGTPKKERMTALSLKRATLCDGNCLDTLAFHPSWSSHLLDAWPPGSCFALPCYHLESEEFPFGSRHS